MKRPTQPKLFAILAAATFVVGSGLTYWQYNSMSAQSEEVARLEKLVQDEEKLKRKLSETEATLLETSTKLSHLEKGVPQLAYVPTLLAELESIGKANGIDVLGVRPVVKAIAYTPQKDGESSSAASRKPYEEMNIEVKGRGSYRSVMNFIKALQTFPKIVEARMISMSPKQLDPGKSGGNLEVSIELRAYLFKQSAKSNASAQNGGEGVISNEG